MRTCDHVPMADLRSASVYTYPDEEYINVVFLS